MLELLGMRQKELLELLLKNKSGMTVDELSDKLAITRNAVRQHLAALENAHLVTKGETRPSGGRPEQLYILTKTGQEAFPKHYSWFAQLLVDSILAETGAEQLEQRLHAMGVKVATQLLNDQPPLQNVDAKIDKLSQVMRQMGYNARVARDEASGPMLEADNCVFHALAVENPSICRFDLALISTFTGCEIDHQECMAKGENTCRFRLARKPS